MTGSDAPRIRALTHDGGFHADEATAYAVLALAEPETVPSGFVRTREPELIERAEIVFDVGGVYDPARHRYDHHMRDKPLRADGTPYSSAGLVWAAFGRQALRMLQPELAEQDLEEVWQTVDREFMLPIDRIDNGIGQPEALGLSTLVDDMNPAWDEDGATDEAFLEATRLTGSALRRKVAAILARLRARQAVISAAEAAEDPRLIELPASMPWEEVAFDRDLPVLFAVYPDRKGRWRIDCMHPEPGSFAQRLPLPEAWAGLSGPDLQRVSGVPDATFVHPARFTGGAASREGILAMARAALAGH
jgi:uncharacterized UPF0160 family protein